MSTIYFTITATKFYYGKDFFEAGQKVHLVKDPENEHDSEAIKVEMDGLKQVGFVANSTYTVVGESMSAGRLYDKIGDTAEGTVKYVLNDSVLCELDPESLIANPEIEDAAE